MKENNGFTLIELIIVVAVIAIIAAIVIPLFTDVTSDRTLSIGYNGAVETRCVDGYKFIIGADGSAKQVMSEFGEGVRCSRDHKSQ